MWLLDVGMAFRIGGARVDLEAGSVTSNGVVYPLTPLEAALLDYLAARPGRIVPRGELLTEVWGYRPTVRSRAPDTLLFRLREKIERSPYEPEHLITVYGQGLKLVGVTFDGDVVPVPAGRFFGRRVERKQLQKALVRGPAALLGPPGSGKSRLAREFVADGLVRSVFVELSHARTGHDIDEAVVAALGLGGAGDPSKIAAHALRARGELLLVLDGCEQVIQDVATRIVPWRAFAPQLSVLVTSRTPLPLDVARIRLEGLDEPDAVALFVARARLVEPSFRPTPKLRELLERIDRIPLAIEILASRAAMRSVEELSDLAQDSGLCGAVDAVLALLTSADREFVSALSVFESPFSLESASAICGRPQSEALDGMQRLVWASLLRVLPASELGAPETRYVLYTLVREHLFAQLNRESPVFTRHGRWFMQMGSREAISRSVVRGEQRVTLQMSLPEQRVAFERAQNRAIAFGCGMAILAHSSRVGPVAYGLAVARRMHALAESDDDRVLLAKHYALLLKFTADHQLSLEITAAALQVATDPEDIVSIRLMRQIALDETGQHEAARAELEAAAPLAERSGNAYGAYLMGKALLERDIQRVEALLLQGISVSSASGNLSCEARSYGLLGHAMIEGGDWSKARLYLERALALFETDATLLRAHSVSLLYFGELEAKRGAGGADTLLQRAAQMAASVGNRDTEIGARIVRAQVWAARGETSVAVAALREVLAIPLPTPSWLVGRAQLVLAEAELLDGHLGMARQWAESAVKQAIAGKWSKLHAATLELLAVLDACEGSFDEARARIDEARSLAAPLGDAVRTIALQAWVEALENSTAAEGLLQRAHVLAARFEMCDDSTEYAWVRQAQRARQGAHVRAARIS